LRKLLGNFLVINWVFLCRQEELLLGILADNMRLGIVPQDEESKRSKKIKERAEKTTLPFTAERRVELALAKNPDAGL